MESLYLFEPSASPKEKKEPASLTHLCIIMATADAKVKKQIEFYFSDANFRRDKFMRGESEKVRASNGCCVHRSVVRTYCSLSDEP